MRALRLALLLGAALAAAPAVQAQSTVTPTPDRKFTALDVFNLEFVSDPQVAPDGKTVVYVRRSNDIMTDRSKSAVWAVDLASGEHRPLITGAGNYASPRWSPDGDRLLFVATEPQRKAELKVMRLADRAQATIAAVPEGPRAPVWSPDGKQVAFTMLATVDARSLATAPKKPEGAEWAGNARVFDKLQIHADGQGWLKPGSTHVFVVPADGGTPRDLTPGKVDFGGVEWLNDGTVLAVGNESEQAELQPNESDIFAIDVFRGTRKAMTTRKGEDNNPTVSPDRKLIAYTGADTKAQLYTSPRLYVMNADGTGSREIAAGQDLAWGSLQWAPDGRSIYTLVQTRGEVRVVRVSLDGKVETVTREVGAGANGRPYGQGEYNVGGPAKSPVVAFGRDSWTRPADLAVLTVDGKTRTLTDLNSDLLAQINLGAIEPLKVKNPTDGRETDAWVVKPPGFKPDGTFPLILEIHGGPSTMYSPTFSSEIQRYAAEGFVVVFANPRGSTGYGEAFANLIDQDFPNKDADDLLAAVDAVLAKGYADPKRTFITGGSYGGLMTAHMVGKTDRFVAAAAANPVINWTSIGLAGDTSANVVDQVIRGYAWEKRDEYWRASPLSTVGKVKTPTLLMVGDDDWRTPPFEAEQFYSALKLRGVDTVLVRIPTVGHNLSARPSTHNAKVDNIIAWFKAHDPKK